MLLVFGDLVIFAFRLGLSLVVTRLIFAFLLHRPDCRFRGVESVLQPIAKYVVLFREADNGVVNDTFFEPLGVLFFGLAQLELFGNVGLLVVSIEENLMSLLCPAEVPAKGRATL